MLRTERRERLQASGTLKCWCCGARHSSSKWRTSKDKSEGKKDLCNKCYLKECRSTKQAMESGKSCCVCSTQITTEWKAKRFIQRRERQERYLRPVLSKRSCPPERPRPRWKVKLSTTSDERKKRKKERKRRERERTRERPRERPGVV